MNKTDFERIFNKGRNCMYHNIFLLLLRLSVIGMSLFPVISHATDWETRQREAIDKQEQKAGIDGLDYEHPFDPHYGGYNYNDSPYPTAPIYPNTAMFPNYPYNPGMYNSNTNFVNPPSSLNSPTGYPM